MYISEESTVLPTDKYLEAVCHFPGEIYTLVHRLAITAVLMGVGCKLKEMIIVSQKGDRDRED